MLCRFLIGLIAYAGPQLHDELVQRAADEARRAERKRRHRIDDLRYALRKVPRIDIEMTFDEVSLMLWDNHPSQADQTGRALYEGSARVQGYNGGGRS